MTSRIVYNNPDRKGALGLPYHYELLADRRRLAPLKRAIAAVAKGKRVLESGAGSGILSILAARAGAARVYATEPDPRVARFTRDNIAKSGYSSVIRIIEKDTRAVTLADIDDERVEVVVAEHLSTWQVTEAQIPVMNHINGALAKPRAICLPESASNRAELAFSKYSFEDIVELRTAYFGFTGIPKPAILSEPVEVHRVQFSKVNAIANKHAATLIATVSGVVNSLRLTSPLVIFRDIRFQSSDSLVPPVIVPLERDVEVTAGDAVRIRVAYECETDWGRVECDARVIKRPAASQLGRPPKAMVYPTEGTR